MTRLPLLIGGAFLLAATFLAGRSSVTPDAPPEVREVQEELTAANARIAILEARLAHVDEAVLDRVAEMEEEAGR